MTGLPELNFPAFYAKQKELEAKGYTCVNPADVGKAIILPEGLLKDEIYLTYMKADIAAMCPCDSICMLKGWWRSRGARIEWIVAKLLRMRVVYQ